LTRVHAFEVIRTLKARQSAILDSLPVELRDEYLEIESFVRYADQVVFQNGASVRLPIPERFQHLFTRSHMSPDDHEAVAAARTRLLLAGRVTLGQRREALRRYLASFGPATRGRILRDTGIPPGTLSTLLTEDEFEKSEDGLWQLGKPRKPKPR
jgi:hypothetical protein